MLAFADLASRITIAAVFILFFMGPLNLARASGLESNGIGVRGRAMGNAMVAVADDWTAAFYNPAGLVWMDRDQTGIVYEYFTGGLESTASLRNLPLLAAPDPGRGDFVDPIGDEPGSFSESKIDADVHYFEYGCAWKRGRAGFGLAIYGSGSGTDWDDRLATAGGDVISARIGFTNGSANIPLSAGIPVSEKVSIGSTLTLRYGLLDVDIAKKRTGSIPYSQSTTRETQALAASADIGVLWRVSDRFSLGAVARLPYRINKTGSTRIRDSLGGIALKRDTSVREDYPLRLAAGVAWRPSLKDLVAFSLTWLNWDQYEQRTTFDNPVPGILEDSSGNPARWQNTVTAGIGYERVFGEKWTGRLGLLYDQAPEPEEYRTLIGGLVVDSWKLSSGVGVNLNGASFNMGYSFTYGPEVPGYIEDARYSSLLHEVYAGVDWEL